MKNLELTFERALRLQKWKLDLKIYTSDNFQKVVYLFIFIDIFVFCILIHLIKVCKLFREGSRILKAYQLVTGTLLILYLFS